MFVATVRKSDAFGVHFEASLALQLARADCHALEQAHHAKELDL
jgi:hypothetical protein